MKQSWIIIATCMAISSCSSMKKTIIYSSLAGGVAGVSTGVLLSPNQKSNAPNAALFGILGAGITALTSAILYKKDPRNYSLKNMLLGKSERNNSSNKLAIDVGHLKIDANIKEAYRVPLKKLPKKLKSKIADKIGRQYLIRHQSPERVVRDGHQTFYIPAFEVYEHAYGPAPIDYLGGIDEK